MWIADLSPWGRSPRLLAVGWLERGHAHALGEVAPEVYATLANLLVDPWQPFCSVGLHSCDLCAYAGEKSGTANVFIPGDTCVFVAPELILHYMNAHHYRPPEAFCRAVLACPPMRTMAYRRALLAAGGAGFFEELGAD